jgi:hypothetical protein
MPDLEDTIADNAAGPKRVESDSLVVEQHPLPDQIDADRYLASKAASTGGRRGLRFNKLVPPGSA